MSSILSTTSNTSSVRHTTLTPGETDLWELCYYAGINVDPQVFRILVDLLRMDVNPKAVIDVLKSMTPHSKFFQNLEQSGDGVAAKPKPRSGKQPESKDSTKVLSKTDRKPATKQSKHPSKQSATSASQRESKSTPSLSATSDDKRSVSSTSSSSKSTSTNKSRVKVSSTKKDSSKS